MVRRAFPVSREYGIGDGLFLMQDPELSIVVVASFILSSFASAERHSGIRSRKVEYSVI